MPKKLGTYFLIHPKNTY